MRLDFSAKKIIMEKPKNQIDPLSKNNNVIPKSSDWLRSVIALLPDEEIHVARDVLVGTLKELDDANKMIDNMRAQIRGLWF